MSILNVLSPRKSIICVEQSVLAWQPTHSHFFFAKFWIWPKPWERRKIQIFLNQYLFFRKSIIWDEEWNGNIIVHKSMQFSVMVRRCRTRSKIPVKPLLVAKDWPGPDWSVWSDGVLVGPMPGDGKMRDSPARMATARPRWFCLQHLVTISLPWHFQGQHQMSDTTRRWCISFGSVLVHFSRIVSQNNCLIEVDHKHFFLPVLDVCRLRNSIEIVDFQH